MRLTQYTMYGYLQLSLAHFKCHEGVSDSPTTRFRVTLHRCFGEHLEPSFRKRRPMDDNAHARYTRVNFMHIWNLLDLGRSKTSARTA